MTHCTLCPRKCGANRQKGEMGFCRSGSELKAARAALHFWEEPCISGETGSGAVFFSGCSLGCVYCQNREISGGENGKTITASRLAEIFFELQEKGACNINLVTPTHFLPGIREAILLAKQRHFSLPIIYNCGGYESAEALQILEGLIDIYLPDFKYMNPETAKRYSRAEDYPQQAKSAIAEMFRQVGDPVFDQDGNMRKGMIVRHLLLPGSLEEAKQILAYLFEIYGNRIYYSLMNQFTPMSGLTQYPELNRIVSQKEYDALVDYGLKLGIENGFIQEGGTAEESFIPAFDGQGI